MEARKRDLEMADVLLLIMQATMSHSPLPIRWLNTSSATAAIEAVRRGVPVRIEGAGRTLDLPEDLALRFLQWDIPLVFSVSGEEIGNPDDSGESVFVLRFSGSGWETTLSETNERDPIVATLKELLGGA
jgi:hypothetical protein